nr:hypothetical protein [uncultured bacterium]
MTMHLDESHPDNTLVLDRLRARRPNRAPIAPPESETYAYTQLGCHPDIVERIWDAINPQLPGDSRAVVYATPALVQPRTGLVIAIGYGTRYALRLPAALVDEAIARGCSTTQTWSGGGMSDVAAECGDGWLFGNWLADEAVWLSHWW